MCNFLLEPTIISFEVGMMNPGEHFPSMQSSDNKFIKIKLFDLNSFLYSSDVPYLILLFKKLISFHLIHNLPYLFDLFNPEKCSVLFFKINKY